LTTTPIVGTTASPRTTFPPFSRTTTRSPTSSTTSEHAKIDHTRTYPEHHHRHHHTTLHRVHPHPVGLVPSVIESFHLGTKAIP
uniref:Ovule protein n=1 Tax=Heligmosomoides polygyrus TaxID=6339 RepID=A0A183F4T3_HELPZ